MAIKRPSGTRSEVVRCPNCGEDYSVTYKRCPFCDERNLPPEEYDDEPDDDYIEGEDDEAGDRPTRKSGKRVAGTQRRGGGYGGGGWGVMRILGTVLSLALIVAAVWIVFNVISPMVGRSNIEPTPSVLPTASPVVTPTVTPTDDLPANSGEPTPPVVSGESSVTPPATSGTPVAGNLKLSSEDFTLRTVGETSTLKASGASGSVTYKSDKPEVASVDANGKVTAISKGTANITATDASGATAKCIVRCSLPEGAAPQPTPSAAQSTNLKLSREDFTLEKAGAKYQLKVTGTSSTPTWSISGDAVATISGDGTVTAVSKGTATVTCKVDGQTLKCIVRCVW